MKRVITFCLFLLLASTGCVFMEEADTIDPGDETYNNPLAPQGSITTLTATVGDLSEANPYITITFSSPIDTLSVNYDVNVIVQYPAGVTTLTEGTGPGTYEGITNSGKIVLDLTDSGPTSGSTVRVTLTAGIKAYADSTVGLTPVTEDKTLPLP